MIVIFEEGGNCYLIEGISAMYPNTIVAIDPMRLDSSFYWKNIARLKSASRNMGMNMVKSEFPGYL
jgi:hypothetical protein